MHSSSVGTRWTSTSSTLALKAYTENRPPRCGLTIENSLRRYHLLGPIEALLAFAALMTFFLSPQTGGDTAVLIHREILALIAIAATALGINRARMPTREVHLLGSVQPSATPATPSGDNAHRLRGLAGKQELSCQIHVGLLRPCVPAITSGSRQFFAFSWIFAKARNLTMVQPMSGGKGQQGLINVPEAKSGYPSISGLVLELAQCR